MTSFLPKQNRKEPMTSVAAPAAASNSPKVWVIQAVGRSPADAAFLNWLGKAVPRVRTSSVPSRHDFLCHAFEAHAAKSLGHLGCPLPPSTATWPSDGDLPALPPVGDGVRTEKQRAIYPHGRSRWILNATSIDPWHRQYLSWWHSIPRNGGNGVASRHDLLWEAFRALADRLRGRFSCPLPDAGNFNSTQENAEVTL